MRVLMIHPGKDPEEAEISGSLAAMQKIVGGSIQAVYPFQEPVALVCNDEGKMMGLPLNRAVYLPGTRQLYDIVAGTFFICGIQDNAFASLTDEQVQMFRERFRRPESFLKVNGRIIAIPIEEKEENT